MNIINIGILAHVDAGKTTFELCYNTIKPTKAITIYPKRDLSPLIRF